MEEKKIVIVGRGALGIMLGDFFVRRFGTETLRFVANPERLQRYEQEPVFCNGQRCDFRYSDGHNFQADFLIFAVKTTGLQNAIEEAAPCVGPGTTILSVLNGVESEGTIGATLGMEKVIGCVAQGMDPVMEENQVIYQMPGTILLGISPEEPEKQPRLEKAAELFAKAGMPYFIDEDIQHSMWGKLMVNVGVNQACMVYETNYGGVQQPGEARETMITAMNETRKIAACQGILITQKDLKEYLALIDSITPEGMPSMRQDGLAGRKTEVDSFSGVILRLAERYGMSVPVNRRLYDKIHQMEAFYEK